MCMGIYIYIDRLVVHVPGGENHHGVDDIYIAPGGPDATRHQLASMPARAHRRAPDPLAGAVNPLPPCRGLSPMAPRGSGLALYAPLPKPPGRWPPSTPDPPAVRRTGESVKSPYLPPRRGSSPTPPPKPRLPKPREGAPAPCVHPAPRASRSAARFARRLRLHLTRRCGQLPRRANWRPTPPFPGPRSPAGRPSPRGWGRGDRRWRTVTWGPACRGVVPRGSPCQGPHRNIPRHPGTPHATRRGHSCGPSLPQPRTVGPGSLLHRLTDPIWGVKMQNAVEVARNCSGGQFLYGGGPCTAKSPYKVGHFFEKLSDILGT